MDQLNHKDGKFPKPIYNYQVIAQNLVKSAMDGDMDSIREVINRIDGKPDQNIKNDTTVTMSLTADAGLLKRVKQDLLKVIEHEGTAGVLPPVISQADDPA